MSASRVSHGEAIGCPDRANPCRSLEREIVDDGARAAELTRELAAILEEPEDARELSFPAQSPALVGKEDLAHALEVHASN